MTAPHDAPTATELLEAVREWIDREVIPSTDGRLRFHARVASNVLGMVEREIELGPSQQVAHKARLAQLGVASDAELAAGGIDVGAAIATNSGVGAELFEQVAELLDPPRR